MLSAHEIATLLVVGRSVSNTGNPVDLHPGDIDSLVSRRLVQRHQESEHGFQVSLTPDGASLIDALTAPPVSRGGFVGNP